jgi:hypothetical protein
MSRSASTSSVQELEKEFRLARSAIDSGGRSGPGNEAPPTISGITGPGGEPGGHLGTDVVPVLLQTPSPLGRPGIEQARTDHHEDGVGPPDRLLDLPGELGPAPIDSTSMNRTVAEGPPEVTRQTSGARRSVVASIGDEDLGGTPGLGHAMCLPTTRDGRKRWRRYSGLSPR